MKLDFAQAAKKGLVTGGISAVVAIPVPAVGPLAGFMVGFVTAAGQDLYNQSQNKGPGRGI